MFSSAVVSPDQFEMSMVAIEYPEKMSHIGADGWKIVPCTDGELTAAKACELIRDMLAGRSYRVPDYVVGEAKIPEKSGARWFCDNTI